MWSNRGSRKHAYLKPPRRDPERAVESGQVYDWIVTKRSSTSVSHYKPAPARNSDLSTQNNNNNLFAVILIFHEDFISVKQQNRETGPQIKNKHSLKVTRSRYLKVQTGIWSLNSQDPIRSHKSIGKWKKTALISVSTSPKMLSSKRVNAQPTVSSTFYCWVGIMEPGLSSCLGLAAARLRAAVEKTQS